MSGKIKPIQLKDVYAIFGKYFEDYDFQTLDIFLATVMSNALPGDPFWLCLVAPASYGKTTLVETIDGMESVIIMNEFTHASIFPVDDKTESVAKKWDGKTVVITDGAQLFTLHSDHKKRVWGALRPLYDGRISRTTMFGEVDFKLDKAPTLILCSTPILDRQITFFNELGSREFIWRMKRPKMKSIPEMDQLGEIKKKMKIELGEIVRKYILQCSTQDLKIRITPEEYDRIGEQGIYLAKMRASGLIDRYSGELADIVSEESPIRAIQCLCKIFKALKIIKAPEPLKIIERLVKNTIDPKRIIIFENLDDGEEKTAYIIAKETNLNRKTVKGILMILKGVKLLDNRLETDDYNPRVMKLFWFNPHIEKMLENTDTKTAEGEIKR